MIPPSPNTPSNAVPSRDTQFSGSKPPKNKKFSEKVKWKIANKIKRNIGIPQILCVSTLSALSDGVTTNLSLFLRFSAGEKYLVMYLYLASATSASKSSPNISSW